MELETRATSMNFLIRRIREPAVRVLFVIQFAVVAVSALAWTSISWPFDWRYVLADLLGVLLVTFLMPHALARIRQNNIFKHPRFFPLRESWLTWIVWLSLTAAVFHLLCAVRLAVVNREFDYHIVRLFLVGMWLMLIMYRKLWNFPSH